MVWYGHARAYESYREFSRKAGVGVICRSGNGDASREMAQKQGIQQESSKAQASRERRARAQIAVQANNRGGDGMGRESRLTTEVGPISADAERFVLGSIMLDADLMHTARPLLACEDF